MTIDLLLVEDSRSSVSAPQVLSARDELERDYALGQLYVARDLAAAKAQLDKHEDIKIIICATAFGGSIFGPEIAGKLTSAYHLPANDPELEKWWDNHYFAPKGKLTAQYLREILDKNQHLLHRGK